MSDSSSVDTEQAPLKHACRRICEQLHMPLRDPFSQNWECELPATFRTAAWLGKYIRHYCADPSATAERHILMALMLDIANEAEETPGQQAMAGPVLALLSAHRIEHEDLIDYWALEDTSVEDAFALTPAIRQLKATPLVQSPMKHDDLSRKNLLRDEAYCEDKT